LLERQEQNQEDTLAEMPDLARQHLSRAAMLYFRMEGSEQFRRYSCARKKDLKKCENNLWHKRPGESDQAASDLRV
jgi:hypothetical protein